MKKLFCILFFTIALLNFINAQVFNTGQTLKKGAFSFGVEPAIIANGNSDFILFLHGGYGIKKGIDFGVKAGLFERIFVDRSEFFPDEDK